MTSEQKPHKNGLCEQLTGLVSIFRPNPHVPKINIKFYKTDRKDIPGLNARFYERESMVLGAKFEPEVIKRLEEEETEI